MRECKYSDDGRGCFAPLVCMMAAFCFWACAEVMGQRLNNIDAELRQLRSAMEAYQSGGK